LGVGRVAMKRALGATRAEAVELEVLALERAAAGVESLAGTVTVSAPPVLLSRLLVPVLRAFAAAYPQVTLHLVGERRQAQMLRAEADLALRVRLAADWIVAHWEDAPPG